MENIKRCCNCKINKSKDNFNKNRTTNDGLSSECKECLRKANLFRRYKITVDQYNLLFLKQEGNCAICKKHQVSLRETLNVDHCHYSNKVRGLLCNKCNQGIGLFGDNIFILEYAIEYLKN